MRHGLHAVLLCVSSLPLFRGTALHAFPCAPMHAMPIGLWAARQEVGSKVCAFLVDSSNKYCKTDDYSFNACCIEVLCGIERLLGALKCVFFWGGRGSLGRVEASRWRGWLDGQEDYCVLFGHISKAHETQVDVPLLP